MPRKSREPLTKVCWRVFTEDLLYLQSHHADVNTLIRALIHAYVERAKMRDQMLAELEAETKMRGFIE